MADRLADLCASSPLSRCTSWACCIPLTFCPDTSRTSRRVNDACCVYSTCCAVLMTRHTEITKFQCLKRPRLVSLFTTPRQQLFNCTGKSHVHAVSALWQHSIMCLVTMRLAIYRFKVLDSVYKQRFQVQVTKAHSAHFQQAYRILCI